MILTRSAVWVCLVAFFAVCGLLEIWTTNPSRRFLSRTLPAFSVFGGSPTCGVNPVRVLVAISHYGSDHPQYVEHVMDALRDMCEAGLHIRLVLYKTLDDIYSYDESFLLSARMQCRNPVGSFQTRVEYLPKETGTKFAAPHRQMFFDNAEKYDLFIYNEDDILIRLQHLLAYLDETTKLKERVGQADFLKFSVGFLRYEIHPATKQRTQWEHDEGFQLVSDARLGGKYFTSVDSFHHQGMYMATREQLLGWKNSCKCFRDPLEDYPEIAVPYFREHLSSLCLFMHCKVSQVIPRDAFQDFTVHHLPNKYLAEDAKGEKAGETMLKIFTDSAGRQVALRKDNGFVLKFND